MATEPVTEKTTSPPYVSFRTFLNMLLRMEEEGGVPSHVDKSYLKNLAGGVQNQLLAGLRWLDLIEKDGRVTQELRDMGIDSSRRVELVGQMLRARYPEVIALAEDNGTQDRLIAAFKSLGATNATLRKSITFFLKAAEFSGIPMSPYFKAPPDVAGASKTKSTVEKRPSADRGGNSSEDEDVPEPEDPQDPQPPVGPWDPAIVGLLNKLPQPGATIDEPSYKRFMTAFGAVLQVIYEVETDGS